MPAQAGIQTIVPFYTKVCFALLIHLGPGVKPQDDKMNNLLDCHASARNDNEKNLDNNYQLKKIPRTGDFNYSMLVGITSPKIPASSPPI